MTNASRGADVVVVGAGIVGAACAAALARSGLQACVIDRADPAAGSSSSGEGNLLVSDKGRRPRWATWAAGRSPSLYAPVSWRISPAAARDETRA